MFVFDKNTHRGDGKSRDDLEVVEIEKPWRLEEHCAHSDQGFPGENSASQKLEPIFMFVNFLSLLLG